MGESHPLILTFRRDGLKDLDPSNVDEVHKMWHAFSKAKHSIDGGDRLEYLSWRLYSREMLRRQSGPPRIYLEPQPVIADKADIEELNDSEISSSSEDDWEAADDSYESTDLRLTSDRFVQNAPRSNSSITSHLQNSSAANNLHESGHQMSPGSKENSRVKLSKPFSSIELENLFSDVQENTVPLKNSVNKTQPPQPLTIDLKCGRVLTPQNSEGSAISQFSSNYRAGPPLRSQDPTILESSSTVRGFSPLSVSISKQPNLHEADSHDFDNEQIHHIVPAIEEKSTAHDYNEPDTNLMVTKKMFYLGSQESDLESSTPGSIEPAIERNIPQNPNTTENNSDWDDVDETDDDDDTAEEEARRKDMFKERPVPTKPLLKRSLLSSMFVSSMKITDQKPEPEPETPVRPSIPSDVNLQENDLDAPANILLEAPLAPHLPFTTIPDLDKPDSYQPSKPGISPPKRISSQATAAHAGSLSDEYKPWVQDQSIAHRTHIIARPEMYRASSSLAQQTRKRSNEKPPEDWEDHNDIFGPLNYHSRGW